MTNCIPGLHVGLHEATPRPAAPVPHAAHRHPHPAPVYCDDAGVPIVVHVPTPGTCTDVMLIPGHPVLLDFNPLDAQAVRHGRDLQLTMPDGGCITLHNAVGTPGPVLQLPDGTELSVKDLFTAYNLGEVVPAAGPPGPAAGAGPIGSAVFAPFEPGELGPGLTPLGPLDFEDQERSLFFARGAGGEHLLVSDGPELDFAWNLRDLHPSGVRHGSALPTLADVLTHDGEAPDLGGMGVAHALHAHAGGGPAVDPPIAIAPTPALLIEQVIPLMQHHHHAH
jgi:hypothetical protein